MMKSFETTLFFATTVAALSLAAVVGVQEFRATSDVQQAVAMPLIQLEAVEIVAERQVIAQAPEQVSLVR